MTEIHIKERASEILGVSKKDLIVFERVVDVFNHNFLTGVICRKPNHLYGTLILFRVNEESCEQIIYGTPKLHYPFDREGNFKWPPIKEVLVYDKLDGTNILAYHYYYRGKRFTTFKTRLTPVIRDSEMHSFRTMWCNYLKENSWIKSIIELNPDYHLSFELYGSLNPITVQYDFPIEVALLFGISRIDHSIRPPNCLFTLSDTKTPLGFFADHKEDLTSFYQNLRVEGSKTIEAKGIVLEGYVMYAFCDGQWKQFKVKPKEIEEIHWVGRTAIHKNTVWTTVINAFEDIDNPTIDDIEELLKEEFSDEIIFKSRTRIETAIEKAKEHLLFSQKVKKIWCSVENYNLDTKEDKADLFRYMSKYFNKSEMRKVASIILGGK